MGASWFGRLRQLGGDDRGDALFMVTVMGAVMFFLVTSLIALAVWQQNSASTRTRTTQAMNVADAGINAYLYQLRQNNNYFLTNADTGWVSMGVDGSYRVIASAPTSSAPLTLWSIGNSHNASMTIVTTVGFPTFADYMFLVDTDISIGSGATITGNVRSNGTVTNAGHVAGQVMYANSFVNSGGTVDLGTTRTVTVDFSQVLADMSQIETSATASGTHYPALGGTYQGYLVTLNNTQATVAKITGGAQSGTLGNLTTTGAVTVTIPSSGVLFFDDPDGVYVKGTYSKAVTIASSSSIYIAGNYLKADMAGTYSSGLIGQVNVMVPTAWSTAYLPTDMTVDAAMLAQSGACTADLSNGTLKSSLTINGAIASEGQPNYVSGNSHGFSARYYIYDRNLQLYAPPMFPNTGSTGALHVNSWVESKPVG
jgi:hypothetical protein